MTATTALKHRLNGLLRYLNVRVDTLTAQRAETARLTALASAGYFDRPAFPIPAAFERNAGARIISHLPVYRSRFNDFTDPARNEVGYSFANENFTSPDAEVLYTIIHMLRPRRVVEVGCGYSTKLVRQALLDANLHAWFVGIDPQPRTEIVSLHDEFYPQRVEELEFRQVFARLGEDDILFIDSSHEVKARNDVVDLYLRVLPKLPAGVVIHVHDVFLPYEYPREWVIDNRWGFTEQYLVQSLVSCERAFEVLWPGHFLQRVDPEFAFHFPYLDGRTAKSLWLRKLTEANAVPS